MRIAILEDDTHQAQVLAGWLESDGHHCHIDTKGREFYRTLQRDSFDVLIIDWLVPDMSGLEALRRYREAVSAHTPVLLISVKGAEQDVVTALDAGADDYLIKPIRREEFKARVRALNRRRKTRSAAPFRFDDDRRGVVVGDDLIQMTELEFRLARFLFDHVDEVVSRHHIFDAVWEGKVSRGSRSVDSYVSRIRSKLDLKAPGPWRLESVFQRGYRLTCIDEASRKA